MNSKLENFLLTKDFDHLSSHDKLFVTEFMTELEYSDYRQFLMRSNQVFLSDKANLKHPNLHKKVLLEAYREKYNIPKENAVYEGKNVISYLSNPIIIGIAAMFILVIFVFKFNDTMKSSNTDPSVVTEYLMLGKEVSKLKDKSFDINSKNMVTNLLEKVNDTSLKEFKAMNEHMIIHTYALEAEAVMSID